MIKTNTVSFVTVFLLLLVVSLSLLLPFFSGLPLIGCKRIAIKQRFSGIIDDSGLYNDNNTFSQDKEPFSQQKQERFFVLHIGPPKTGTSTIQGVAVEHENLLQRDNIYYLGHNGKKKETKLHELSKFCRKCDRQEGCVHCPKRWQDFEEIVDSHLEAGHNVFLSDETLNRFFSDDQEANEFVWTRLANIVNKFARVDIVYTYRRYHDWVPSNYHQSWNPMGNRDPQGRARWPDEGGPTIPTFESNFDTLEKYKQPLYILKQWRDHFDHVSVFNMHKETDFVKSFYCDELPQARHLCQYLSTRVVELTKNPSTSKTLHFDMLAVEAYKRGMIPENKRHTRPEVTLAIEQHAKSLGMDSVMDFATTCLSPAQEQSFLKDSLELEKAMTSPEFYASERGEAEIRQQFAESVEKGKFCSINVDLTLKDPQWQDFFQQYTDS